MLKKLFCIFPEKLRKSIEASYSLFSDIYEIRLISEVSLFYYTSRGVRFIGSDGTLSLLPTEKTLKPASSELEEIINRATSYSGFFYEKELKNGFITLGDGIRIGICSDGFSDNFSVGKISSVAIRLPFGMNRFSCNISDDELFDFRRGLLIAGAPASGKTTLLKYVAKKLSDGVLGEYKKVSVIDERGELSGSSFLGSCTDIIKGKKKADGILHALRLLSPQYIICDEIGNAEETKAILEGLNSGVVFVASIHAESISSLLRRKQFRILFDENVFDKIVFLSSEKTGYISDIFTYEEVSDEINRTSRTLLGSFSDRDIFFPAIH